MNTISAEKLVAGYEQVQCVLVRVGDYKIVIQKKATPDPAVATVRSSAAQPSSSIWIPQGGESRIERGLLALVAASALGAIAYGIATSLGLVLNWGLFQNGIQSLLK